MAEARAFTHACEAIEQRTSLDRLETRGTVRLALKAAGFDPANVTPEEMAVVVQKILPGELSARGIDAPESICSDVAGELSALPQEAAGDTPESVFARLGGS